MKKHKNFTSLAAMDCHFVSSVNTQLMHHCGTHYAIIHYWPFFEYFIL